MVYNAKAEIVLVVCVALWLTCSSGCRVADDSGQGNPRNACPLLPHSNPPAHPCQVRLVEPCFYGYEATCWHPWPDGWVGCPPCSAQIGTTMNVVGEIQPGSPTEAPSHAPADPLPVVPNRPVPLAPDGPLPTDPGYPAPIDPEAAQPVDPSDLDPAAPIEQQPVAPTEPRSIPDDPAPVESGGQRPIERSEVPPAQPSEEPSEPGETAPIESDETPAAEPTEPISDNSALPRAGLPSVPVPAELNEPQPVASQATVLIALSEPDRDVPTAPLPAVSPKSPGAVSSADAPIAPDPPDLKSVPRPRKDTREAEATQRAEGQPARRPVPSYSRAVLEKSTLRFGLSALTRTAARNHRPRPSLH